MLDNNQKKIDLKNIRILKFKMNKIKSNKIFIII